MVGECGRLLVLLLVASSSAKLAMRRDPRGAGGANPEPVDRTLHVRSIPAVSGYNSHIYEVLMTPYLDKADGVSGHAVAELRVAEGRVLGEVTLRESSGSSGGLQLSGTLAGLTPGQLLGITVHESGDCRQLGPIFRPDQPANSVPSPAMPAGFLGSTIVSAEGRVLLSLTLGPRLALTGHRSVLARAVALHPLAAPGQPQSTAVACGVLGRAPPSPAETAAARRRRHFQHPRH